MTDGRATSVNTRSRLDSLPSAPVYRDTGEAGNTHVKKARAHRYRLLFNGRGAARPSRVGLLREEKRERARGDREASSGRVHTICHPARIPRTSASGRRIPDGSKTLGRIAQWNGIFTNRFSKVQQLSLS